MDLYLYLAEAIYWNNQFFVVFINIFPRLTLGAKWCESILKNTSIFSIWKPTYAVLDTSRVMNTEAIKK